MKTIKTISIQWYTSEEINWLLALNVIKLHNYIVKKKRYTVRANAINKM